MMGDLQPSRVVKAGRSPARDGSPLPPDSRPAVPWLQATAGIWPRRSRLTVAQSRSRSPERPQGVAGDGLDVRLRIAASISPGRHNFVQRRLAALVRELYRRLGQLTSQLKHRLVDVAAHRKIAAAFRGKSDKPDKNKPVRSSTKASCVSAGMSCF